MTDNWKNINGEWLPLLVRSGDYLEFAAMVAERESNLAPEQDNVGDGSPHGTLAPGTGNGPDAGLARYPSWSESALRKLAGSDAVTAQRWTRALDVVAAADGQTWFTTTEVASQAGMSINEWRDAPRKITRHIRANYPETPLSEWGQTWPMLAWNITGSEISWAVTPDTKSRWRMIRGL